MYVSLFEHWKTILSNHHTVDQILEDLVKDLEKIQGIIPLTLVLHDYRDFKIPFISDSVFEMSGYYPENFYANGIEQGFKLLHPDHLSQVLVFQKKAFDFIQKVPKTDRFSIKLRYHALVKNRVTEEYKYYQVILRPLIFDENGNILIDLASWTYLPLHKGSHAFEWGLSYVNSEGDLIEETSLEEEGNKAELTSGENRVYKYLILGKTSDEIGNILNISKHTVDTHRRRILKKMKVANTSELIARKNN